MTDLKPCPFCGEKAEIERYGNGRQSTIVNCTMCGCSLETGEEFNHGARWNSRTHDLTSFEARERSMQERAALAVEKSHMPVLPDQMTTREHLTVYRKNIAAAIRNLPTGETND